jgi:signal transduction histidine kinase
LALAKIYMTEAYHDYVKWGAKAKAAELAAAYGNLLALGSMAEWDRIDYLSVVKSAQALSEEMEMPRLLTALLKIMLRNAGAEFGAIIFAQEEGWMVEAYGTADELSVGALLLAEADGLVPAAFIEYAARTKQEVVLHDAAHEGMFVRNAHVRDKRLRSVLCLPIRHQDKLVCLLYMENKLAAGMFTKEKLDVLKLLASQCAISIDNARLYSGIQSLRVSLEQQVEERTRSLKQSMGETAAALAENSVYEERNRIAQEIHDVVGHTLTSTVLQIEAGKRLLHKDKEGAVTRLEGAQELVRHGLNEIRRSVHMLKEGQAFNLGHQLRQLIQDTEHHTGVVIKASMGDLPDLTMPYKKLIYHALQEGLTNGIRHGGASYFRFLLAQEGKLLVFQLQDNGRGAAELVTGFGLNVMRERAEQLDGILTIETQGYGGCLLRIEIPLVQPVEKGKEVE